jgi:hypothetical protein
MSKLYTVQLKFGYRFVMDYAKGYDEPISLLGIPYVAAFNRKKDAECYVKRMPNAT